MSISLNGFNTFQRGLTGEVAPYIMTTAGTIPLSSYSGNSSSYGGGYTNGVDATGGYTNSDTGRRLKAFDTMTNLAQDHLFEEHYNSVMRSARKNESLVGSAFTAAAATGVDFDAHFADAQTDLGDQLKSVAKLIAANGTLGNQRQIFYVNVGGYDTHSGMLDGHASLMNELSQALVAFRNTLKDPTLNLFDNVTTFTASEFGRTLTSNGADPTSSGTDHAWAGTSIIMGGAVNGGQLYGHYPSLKVGDQAGSIDSHTSRGRFIPDVSVDQYSAVIANWLDVESGSMDVLFPNLHRFDDPLTTSTANLNNLIT